MSANLNQKGLSPENSLTERKVALDSCADNIALASQNGYQRYQQADLRALDAQACEALNMVMQAGKEAFALGDENKLLAEHIGKMLKDTARPEFWARILNLLSSYHEYGISLKQTLDKIRPYCLNTDKEIIDLVLLFRRRLWDKHRSQFKDPLLGDPKMWAEFNQLLDNFENDKEACVKLFLGENKINIASYIAGLSLKETMQDVVSPKLCKLSYADSNCSYLKGPWNNICQSYVNQVLQKPFMVDPKDYKALMEYTSLDQNDERLVLKQLLGKLEALLVLKREQDKFYKNIEFIWLKMQDIAKRISVYHSLYYSMRTMSESLFHDGMDFDPQKFNLHHVVSGLFTETNNKFGTIRKDLPDGERHFLKVANLCQVLNDFQLLLMQAVKLNTDMTQSLSAPKTLVERDFAPILNNYCQHASKILGELQQDVKHHLYILMGGLNVRSARFNSLNSTQVAQERQICYAFELQQLENFDPFMDPKKPEKSKKSVKNSKLAVYEAPKPAQFNPTVVRGILHEPFYPVYMKALNMLLIIEAIEAIEATNVLQSKEKVAKIIATRILTFFSKLTGSKEAFALDHYLSFTLVDAKTPEAKQLAERDNLLRMESETNPRWIENVNLKYRILSAFLKAESKYLSKYLYELKPLISEISSKYKLYLPGVPFNCDDSNMQKYFEYNYYRDKVLSHYMPSQRIFCGFEGLNRLMNGLQNRMGRDDAILARKNIIEALQSINKMRDIVLGYIMPPLTAEGVDQNIHERTMGYYGGARIHEDERPYMRTAELLLAFFKNWASFQEMEGLLHCQAQPRISPNLRNSVKSITPHFARLSAAATYACIVDDKLVAQKIRAKPLLSMKSNPSIIVQKLFE